ncbi:MAG: GDP-mannose 4,6-dehydratase [Proteobacteria bacterium]|nr:GDP-mannose 4,6-dehydratase [Pseudomonadota bacterium]
MSWKGTRVLVTGAGGFIGSHLVKRLLDEGARVHILLKKNGPVWRIKEVLNRLIVWESDITDLNSLQSIIPRSDPQIIFHLAALVDVSRSWDMILPMTNTNIIGTINLLTALRPCRYETFIQTSSSEEYGYAEPSPLKEDQRESPLSPYSFSKVSSTFFCQMAVKTFDLPITIVRLFPTYGPSQESSMVIPSAIRDLLLKREFKMTPGEQKREFNYVDDVVDAYLKVAACRKVQGEVINIGSGIPYKVKDVVNMIKELIGGDTTVDMGARPYRKGERMECYCNNEKLKKLTGWSPQVSLKEGLRLTVEWYRSFYSREIQ